VQKVGFYAFLFCGLCLFTLLALASESGQQFRYDDQTGQCVNENGDVGYNTFDENIFSSRERIENRGGKHRGREVYANKNAECVDFTGVVFEKYIGVSYSELFQWNFKGANLTNAEIHFNHIKEADLRGADLEHLKFGYAHISGKIDGYTKIPKPRMMRGTNIRKCSIQDDNVECSN